ncbi:DUF2236 domain-containing protein [Kribbella sandramycini]|uniref:DUF2236 domain-containing protein n=1 Tax=Kribbella sandramycini TaxID=60450 RepID=A0A7Y4NXC7_9ACTN|nr:oxygenase MpaB family protein [Kribbella sandramycini]MBB6567647.1 uncharacterized protein (DUF2236 family) [Kribbella sandramycini]NOL39752.1 DUF2236 domain-containing protein [Kribbella sandramycini]
MNQPALRDVLLGVSLLAGSANVVMQLSRPGVGRGVVESRVDGSNLFRHPVRRTRTTLTYLAVATMGTAAEQAAYRRFVNRAHAQVRSTEAGPVAYNAFDPELQLWVAACLYKGFEDTQLAFFRGNAERYYSAAAIFGTMLQVRPELWPADRAAFEEYWTHSLDQVHVDDDVRRYLLALIDLKFLPAWLALPGRRFHRFVTTGFLPPPFRDQLHLTWTTRDQHHFDRLLRGIRSVILHSPGPIRRFPFNLCLWDLRRRLTNGHV